MLTALLVNAGLILGLAGQQPNADAAAAVVARLRASTASPAISSAVVEGEVVWTQDAQRAHRIGSVTKLFTAVALARMADRGAIDLDAPVQRYVAAFPHPGVTIRQLAGHLGGIRHYGAGEYISTTAYASPRDALDIFLSDPLAAAPGERYRYSSYGYNLLGVAMEQAAGAPFMAILQAEVFGPFGLTHTRAQARDDAGEFFSRTDAGDIVPAIPVDVSDRLPSGGLVSTAGDLAAFLQGVASLPASTRALLFTSMTTRDGKETGVGLGWRLATDAAGRRYAHHGGDTVGGRAMVVLYPEDGAGAVLLGNLSFARLTEQDALALVDIWRR